MTTTAQPSAAASGARQAVPADRPARLVELRGDLKLLPGPVQPDGAPSWRIHDPIRNRFFQVGWLEFEMLQRWHAGQTPAALLAQVAAETTLVPTEEEFEELVLFLYDQQLLRADDPALRDRLYTRWRLSQPEWLTWLLHHYLFFRIPLLHPDRFLTRTLEWVRPLFSRRFALLLGAVGLLDVYLVARQWTEVQGAFSYFFNLQGLVYYFMAASLAKVVHELGHAYVSKYFGLRVPTMGIAFLVMWPVLYTDTSESWKLESPRQRLAIAAAGIGAEGALALFAILGWAIAGDGVLRSMLFLLGSSSLLMSLAINVSPFMRFDGYFLLSDALDMPNLHERSFALARRALRRIFFRVETPDPEPQLTPAMRRGLTLFAIVTWLFRFSLFLGIALTVYHLFFKALGICLLMVEVGWFIVRPVWRELAALWSIRTALRPSPRAFAALAAVCAALLWLLPISFHVNAPALVKAADEQALFPPAAAQVREVAVREGQKVVPGQLLVRLSSPELQSRLLRAEYEVHARAVELSRMAAGTRQVESAQVTEQQLAEAVADRQGAQADIARLELRATRAGVVRDLSPLLVAGRWVARTEPLLRVVADRGAEIEAWVDEEQVRSLTPGQRVTFYPDLPEAPVLSGQVVGIDPAGSHALPHPLLASTWGGPIPVRNREGAQAVTIHPLYRVNIRPDAEAGSVQAVERGTVRISTGPVVLVQDFLARIAATLVRESGF